MNISIEFKPTNRIGNGMISAPSKMVADITPKKEIWEKYGDSEIAEMWASQILQHRFPNTECVVLSATVS
jgi:ribosomal protein L16/L10AE